MTPKLGRLWRTPETMAVNKEPKSMECRSAGTPIITQAAITIAATQTQTVPVPSAAMIQLTIEAAFTALPEAHVRALPERA